MYNTKLTDAQKQKRKGLKVAFLEAGGKLFNFEGFTVAIKPAFFGANMAQIAVSMASPDESKLRRKVGEYHALSKLEQGEFIQFPLVSSDYEYFAENLAGFFDIHYE